MPFGRDERHRILFAGWYQQVIEPAVVEAGYEPILAAATDAPNAITDEIRTHLALDPMVVVDLGGATPDDEPNPNVMYELGIRHAFDLPHVITAWKEQRLPFDVSQQRVIMEDRRLLYLPVNRTRLVAFIKNAAEGEFYAPMQAVGRVAQVKTTVEGARDSVMEAAVQQVVTALRSGGANAAKRPRSVSEALTELLGGTEKLPRV